MELDIHTSRTGHHQRFDGTDIQCSAEPSHVTTSMNQEVDEVTQQSDVDVLTNRSRKGAGEYVYNPRLLEIVARRPTYVGLALWFLHHPALVEGHTGGSRFTPTVHPC